jgi:hypothetical protein
MIYIIGNTFIRFNKFCYAIIDSKDQFELYIKGILIEFSLKKYSRRNIIKFVFEKIKEDDKLPISLEDFIYSFKEKMNLECIPTYSKYFLLFKTKKFTVKLRKNSDIIIVHFKESKALNYFSIKIYIPKEWQINFLKNMIRRYLK